MAEHGTAGGHMGVTDDHRSTYEGFIKGAIVLTLVSFYVLVALVSFRFAGTLNVFSGFAGLILGLIAVAIDARSGSRFLLSLGLLLVFGLITAVNVS